MKPNPNDGGIGEPEPVRLAGSLIGHRCHVCAFFHDDEEAQRILLPFIKEGLEQGHKVVQTIDPRRRAEQLDSLKSAGIDLSSVSEKGQLEIRDWSNTHLSDGYFDPVKTLNVFKGVVENAQQEGFTRMRFVTHMEWAVESGIGSHELLEYEARSNGYWYGQTGPINPVLCCYDLRKFGGDIVVDVIRTHPMIIIGGLLQENPFYVPSEDFLRELQARRAKG